MKRSPRPLLSWLFLALSVGLFAAGAVLYVRGRGSEDEAQIPIAAAGENELVHVVAALEAEGLEVKYLPGSDSASSRMLENNVGQPLTVDGERLYVFVYPDANTRDEATLDVLSEDVDLEKNAGDPAAGGSLRLFTGSNVAVVLAGGDDVLADKVSAAVDRLP